MVSKELDKTKRLPLFFFSSLFTGLSLSQDFSIPLLKTELCWDVEALNCPPPTPSSEGMEKVAAHSKMQGIWKECPKAVMCPGDQLAACILFSHSFIPSRHPWFLFQPWVVMTSSSGTATGEGVRAFPGLGDHVLRLLAGRDDGRAADAAVSSSPLLCLRTLLIHRRGWSAVRWRRPRVNMGPQSRNIGVLRKQLLLSWTQRMAVSRKVK